MRSKCNPDRYVAATLAVVFLLSGIAACSREEPEILGSPQGSETWPEEELNTVQVSMVEFEIDIPKLLPPGPTKFIVTNNGQNSHNFAIEGPNVERVLSEKPLKPGQKGIMQIDLKPGKYVVYCPVFNNRDRGMKVNLTVTAGN
ncbi:MAG: cupredoxin domain-containing protein [Candidatus Hydrogenedentes bacterium]|nr:cupredoxin domain-containing protein [Candidatus Hydrogenedentota bacterium]